jgi:hypothetical protein
LGDIFSDLKEIYVLFFLSHSTIHVVEEFEFLEPPKRKKKKKKRDALSKRRKDLDLDLLSSPFTIAVLGIFSVYWSPFLAGGFISSS